MKNEDLSFYDYTLLPVKEQYDLVFTKGKFVDSKTIGNTEFVLYKLFGFYVELKYDIVSNIILEITSFLDQKNI